MLVIIDNEMGNIQSVANALVKLNVEYIISNDIATVEQAGSLIFPGVGAFPMAMANLKKFSLDKVLKEKLVEKNTPFLGICLGMQMLLTESEESEGVGQGGVQGLDLIPGKNVRIRNEKVPHMGWNKLKIVQEHPVVKGVDGLHAYFVHSYHAVPDDNSAVISTTEYGVEFASMIARENVFGTQFHPEKSGETGLKILRNFIEFCRSV